LPHRSGSDVNPSFRVIHCENGGLGLRWRACVYSPLPGNAGGFLIPLLFFFRVAGVRRRGPEWIYSLFVCSLSLSLP
ncbi:MAG TPA: hypothetical protein VHE33_00310, partial [Acidobacteriaceae bacterium]|nr:hypothetical protein [Acidobacteriaceae bacterium]